MHCNASKYADRETRVAENSWRSRLGENPGEDKFGGFPVIGLAKHFSDLLVMSFVHRCRAKLH